MDKKQPYRLSEKGRKPEDVFKEMQERRADDVRWADGRSFCLVFDGGPEVTAVGKEAYNMFFSENALNPTAFPSLRSFENDVVSMMADLMGGDADVRGTMTTGGTESIMMAVKTARDWARANRPEATKPEIIIPKSAHPAFEKGCHYFGLTCTRAELGEDFRVDLHDVKSKINKNTVLLVGSAPSYAQGVVDSIEGLSILAKSNNVLLHVDACIGGFVLAFFRQLGIETPNFNFEIDGVTSLSVDLHKFGYCPKSSSVILYRNKDIRKHQFFTSTTWNGGVFISPSMLGTRAGGSIAGSWAVMQYLGIQGYREIFRTIYETTQLFRDAIEAVDGVHIVGDTDSSILCIGSDELDIFEIADEMTARGWHFDRQNEPDSIHLTIMKAHADIFDEFMFDLRECVAQCRGFSGQLTHVATSVKRTLIKNLPKSIVERLMSKQVSNSDNKKNGKTAAFYGVMGSLSAKGDLKEISLELLDQLYTPKEKKD